MKNIIGNYEEAILNAEALLREHSILPADLIQCDTICYRVETNERYEEIKQQLGQKALLLNEVEVNGRLIASFGLEEPLEAGTQHSISYIELPQPKPGSEYTEGIDHVQFVTRLPLSQFHTKYQQLPFEIKGLASELNPLLKLEGDDISVKFHDKHMGAVIALED
ncbi:MAG TPA: VOC family protein [Candidatus Saccharimonadales bacterium]